MIDNKLNDHKLIIYIDGTYPMFSDRLIKIINNSEVELKSLKLPRRRIDSLNWLYSIWKSEARIVHFIWGTHHPLVYIMLKVLGKKIIIQWIGSDVTDAISIRKSRFGVFRFLMRRIAYNMADMHLADFQPLADQLKTLGISARVLSLVPDIKYLDKRLIWPDGNRAFVYLPETRQKFYGGEIIFRLAQSSPDIEFLITSNTGHHAPCLPNVRYMGYVDDLESIWKQTKVYIRLTEHDGLSHTVIEALSRGKHVIWSYEYPFCYLAHSCEEARDALRDILVQNRPNIEGMNYIKSQFNLSKISQDYLNIYLKLS